MNNLLLVEATEELQPLADELTQAGFQLVTCSFEEAGQQLANGARYDALLVNQTEPAALVALAELLRQSPLPSSTAAIGLIRRDQVAGLDFGPELDDFVALPPAQGELPIRVRQAIRRRAGVEDTDVLRCGDLAIDQASYRVYVGSRPVDLTYKEYELLRFLALNQDKVCTRETLLSGVWGYDFYGGARTVDVHIRRLRSKIEDPGHSLIETVRNVGYRLRAA